jgi:hypothetical protein
MQPQGDRRRHPSTEIKVALISVVFMIVAAYVGRDVLVPTDPTSPYESGSAEVETAPERIDQLNTVVDSNLAWQLSGLQLGEGEVVSQEFGQPRTSRTG